MTIYTIEQHTKHPAHMSTAIDIGYKRADWIGHGRLWPRDTLINADDWTPQQNQQYQCAFDVQRRTIELAALLETKIEHNARIFWRGAVAPGISEDVFDKYLPISKLEAAIKFQEGLIQGLQVCRDRNERMLEVALEEVVGLKKLHKARVEEYWSEYSQHLIRQGKNAFVQHMPIYEEKHVSGENLKKRNIDNDSTETTYTVYSETTEYWLRDNNLDWGLDCIAH